jgi:hypothetical protein
MKKLKEIGNLMSNVFFNWSQQDRFTLSERRMMKSLQAQWDAARLEIAKPKKPKNKK